MRLDGNDPVQSSSQLAAGWLLYGAQTLALLSADVERRSGKYGCHLTLTTLSSCSRVFTTFIFYLFEVSEMYMFLSKPALAKY